MSDVFSSVQAGKLSVQLKRGLFACLDRISLFFKGTEPFHLTFGSDVGAPSVLSFMPENSGVTRSIVSSYLSVVRVLHVGANTKVFASIIEAIAIYMIDGLMFLGAHYDPMQARTILTNANVGDAIVRVGPYVQRKTCDKIYIFLAYEHESSARKSDSRHWCHLANIISFSFSFNVGRF